MSDVKKWTSPEGAWVPADVADDLYEVLAEVVILIPPHYDTADRARAALAKARGESSND